MHAIQRRLLALALYCLAENDDDESVDLQPLQTRASPLAPIRPSRPRLDGSKPRAWSMPCWQRFSCWTSMRLHAGEQ